MLTGNPSFTLLCLEVEMQCTLSYVTFGVLDNIHLYSHPTYVIRALVFV